MMQDIRKILKYSFAFLVFILTCSSIHAQKDTTKRQTVDITSAYKPVLRNAVKINFSASLPDPDTTRQVQPYQVPQQNLFYAYQAIPLRPLAVAIDSVPPLGSRNYVKAGAGNQSAIWVQAGAGFGDGKKYLANLNGSYRTLKGSLVNQQWADFSLHGQLHYFTEKNEWYARAGIQQQDFRLYGYDHQLYQFNSNDIQQRLQNIELHVGLRNRIPVKSELNYDPSLKVNLFSLPGKKITENNLLLTAPVTAYLNDVLLLHVAGQADITTYEQNTVRFNNHVFSLTAAVDYLKDQFQLHAGVKPVWDHGQLAILPDLYAEWKSGKNEMSLKAGVEGRYVKNNFMNLTSANPWLLPLTSQLNSREVEFFGGARANLGKHIQLNLHAGFVTIKNQPLFYNDTLTDEKGFIVMHEPTMNNLRLHADASFVLQEQFTVTAAATLNIYNGHKIQERAWGLNPFEATGSLRWWAFKRLLLKADLWMFAGSPVLLKNNQNKNLAGGFDLGAGLEYRINDRFSAWMDMNNLLNNQYSRWNRYQVVGFNLLGGVLVRF